MAATAIAVIMLLLAGGQPARVTATGQVTLDWAVIGPAILLLVLSWIYIAVRRRGGGPS